MPEYVLTLSDTGSVQTPEIEGVVEFVRVSIVSTVAEVGVDLGDVHGTLFQRDDATSATVDVVPHRTVTDYTGAFLENSLEDVYVVPWFTIGRITLTLTEDGWTGSVTARIWVRKT